MFPPEGGICHIVRYKDNQAIVSEATYVPTKVDIDTYTHSHSQVTGRVIDVQQSVNKRDLFLLVSYDPLPPAIRTFSHCIPLLLSNIVQEDIYDC